MENTDNGETEKHDTWKQGNWALFLTFCVGFVVTLQLLFILPGAALLGRGSRAPEADPHEPVHHVHVRKHHLHLPHHDGLHDGLEAHTGAHVHVCQWVCCIILSDSYRIRLINCSHQVGFCVRALTPFIHSFILSCVSAFKLLESSSQQWLQGLVYLVGNLLGSALAIYKCQSMGLLPTHSSDWLAFIEPPQVNVEGFVNLSYVSMLLTHFQTSRGQHTPMLSLHL